MSKYIEVTVHVIYGSCNGNLCSLLYWYPELCNNLYQSLPPLPMHFSWGWPSRSPNRSRKRNTFHMIRVLIVAFHMQVQLCWTACIIRALFNSERSVPPLRHQANSYWRHRTVYVAYEYNIVMDNPGESDTPLFSPSVELISDFTIISYSSQSVKFQEPTNTACT